VPHYGSQVLKTVTLNEDRYNVQTSSVNRQQKGKGRLTATFIGGGAGAGALIGGLAGAGGGKGALIGWSAVAGMAGSAGLAGTAKDDRWFCARTCLEYFRNGRSLSRVVWSEVYAGLAIHLSTIWHRRGHI